MPGGDSALCKNFQVLVLHFISFPHITCPPLREKQACSIDICSYLSTLLPPLWQSGHLFCTWNKFQSYKLNFQVLGAPSPYLQTSHWEIETKHVFHFLCSYLSAFAPHLLQSTKTCNRFFFIRCTCWWFALDYVVVVDDDAAEPSARLLQKRHPGPQEMDGSREGLTSSKSSKNHTNKQNNKQFCGLIMFIANTCGSSCKCKCFGFKILVVLASGGWDNVHLSVLGRHCSRAPGRHTRNFSMEFPFLWV